MGERKSGISSEFREERNAIWSGSDVGERARLERRKTIKGKRARRRGCES